MTFDGRLFSGITVLAAVAESGSFVRAADALGLSPSGVSRAVSRLEKRVGVRLLDRTTRSQTLLETRIITVASPRYVAEHGQPGKPEEVSKHQRIMFYNPVTAKPFEWEFHRGKKVTEIPAEGRLLVSDVETMLGACIAGAGIAQVMEIGVEQVMRDGLLVDLFPDWSDERFPLYALFPSRRHRAAKVEAFINFCIESLSAAAPVRHAQIRPRGASAAKKLRRTPHGDRDD
ncbi:LysR family transcriptional regulator [Paraburkholderia sp. SIMBA_030]|uniref:LysR family transcriptional regulator n=1 Tax=Paraburkholderia sp. SIMBA_030 TaxID=3085773 RepID=UPI00397B6861